MVPGRRLAALTAQMTARPELEVQVAAATTGEHLLAGVGKMDITKPDVLVPGVDVNQVQATAASAAIDNPMYAKALLIRGASSGRTVGFVTLDLVAYGEIGHISTEFLPRIRVRMEVRPPKITVQLQPYPYILIEYRAFGSGSWE